MSKPKKITTWEEWSSINIIQVQNKNKTCSLEVRVALQKFPYLENGVVEVYLCSPATRLASRLPYDSQLRTTICSLCLPSLILGSVLIRFLLNVVVKFIGWIFLVTTTINSISGEWLCHLIKFTLHLKLSMLDDT